MKIRSFVTTDNAKNSCQFLIIKKIKDNLMPKYLKICEQIFKLAKKAVKKFLKQTRINIKHSKILFQLKMI